MIDNNNIGKVYYLLKKNGYSFIRVIGVTDDKYKCLNMKTHINIVLSFDVYDDGLTIKPLEPDKKTYKYIIGDSRGNPNKYKEYNNKLIL